MLKSDIKKGDWIINYKVPGSKPWYVYGKEYGFVLIIRHPGVGRMTVVKQGQLRDFRRYKKRGEYVHT